MNKLKNEDRAIHNFLISTYVMSRSEQKLLAYLTEQSKVQFVCNCVCKRGVGKIFHISLHLAFSTLSEYRTGSPVPLWTCFYVTSDAASLHINKFSAYMLPHVTRWYICLCSCRMRLSRNHGDCPNKVRVLVNPAPLGSFWRAVSLSFIRVIPLYLRVCIIFGYKL